MDPLSILVSVIGLVNAAGRVSSILTTIALNISEVPQLVSEVLSEVNDVRVSLSALHKLLVGMASVPRRRAALIQLDQLVATLTESVLTFSELEDLLAPFVGGFGIAIMDRAKWIRREEAVLRLMQRLQRHKNSLSLMLNIVQWCILCPSTLPFGYGLCN